MFTCRHIYIFLLTSLAIFLLSASSYAATLRATNSEDPYEPFNRVMFRFNDLFDRIILRPVARVYLTVLPPPLTKGISNAFSNIDTIPTVANDILQGNFYQATSDAWRLAINTTVGIVGLFDVAALMGLPRNNEDLGLTFAQWGYKNSHYLVIPFLGSSTVRDVIAWPINYNYLTIYPHIRPRLKSEELYGLSLVSKRADYIRFQGVMDQAAIDKYAFMRDAYLQRRTYLIERNKQLGDPYLGNSTLDKESR